ncbi:hypothetical protein MTo_02869 [Microcystis aeruginosa NIES-1211]|jgi:uncharacterized protein (DUF2235 family)|uniref:phospholipase effector Tle1 domain-containing protein n=1 Tax=Microcystis TaxID=1125 RepID=UPI000D7C8F5D|nr:DUF2235 domain-containing protein [Microcystis aeruginosa]GBL15555.1 hypothetical protein MTo_02869 [Microcystis aeruginosa NIES-1211]
MNSSQQSEVTGQSVLTFDGIDDYIQLPAANTDYSQGFTVEAWVQHQSWRFWSRIIDFGNGAGKNNIVLGNVGTSNALGLHLYCNNGHHILEAANVLEIGKWTHIGATIDQSGMAKLYKNGQLIQSKQLSLPDNLNRTLNYIGKSNWTNDGYFEGQMTEVRVWNTARLESELQRDMYQRLKGNETGLVAYWPLNEGSENIAKDQTSNDNKGTINGATWQQEQLPIQTQLSQPVELGQVGGSIATPAKPELSVTSDKGDQIQSTDKEDRKDSQLSGADNSEPTKPSHTSKKKRLVVCCDGTWNQLASSYPTNVVKFARLVKHSADDQTPQIVHYISGSGTAEDDNLIERLGGGAFGWGIDRIIQDAYRFLCMNYNVEAEDEIYLVGFSRGAYIVRCLAGMIYKCGLLSRSKIRELPKAYQLYRNFKISPNAPEYQKFRQDNSKKIDTEQDYLQYRVPIKMLGCWDTVGALGVPDVVPWLSLDKLWNRKYEFFDARLSPIVENAFHAVAIDEKRKSFPSTAMEKNEKNPEQVVQQVFFAGEHGCIGGGTEKYRGLSDCTLKWMIDEAKKLGLEFDLTEKYGEEFQIKPEPTTKFDNRVTGLYALGGEAWRPIKSAKVAVHGSVVERLKADPNYRPQNLLPLLQDLLPS